MLRRSVLRLTLAGLALLISAPRGEEHADAGVRRLLLITIDTLRSDHVGAYGGVASTPAMDALAREGVLLLDACTPTPTTGPAHASLLTGLHPWRHGVLDNAVPLPASLPRVSTLLRQSGFTTAAFVASHILDRRFGFAEGFADFSFEPSEEFVWRGDKRGRFWTRGERVAQAAERWIEKHANEPFFLWVHLFDPHSPYEVPDGFAPPAAAPISLSGKRVPPEVSGEAELKSILLAYRGEVAYADAQVGRLVQRLRSLGLLEGTAVVVTADHGEGLGDHGLLEHGFQLFEEQVRVPLLIRAPGLPAGRRLSGAAQSPEDLTPTLLALAGVASPPGLDGLDLGPWLAGRTERSPREAVLGRRKAYAANPDLFFLRAFPKKWIGREGHRGRIFQLDRDPRELTPLQGSTVPAPLRAALDRPRVAPGKRVVDNETRRGLEALGYAD